MAVKKKDPVQKKIEELVKGIIDEIVSDLEEVVEVVGEAYRKGNLPIDDQELRDRIKIAEEQLKKRPERPQDRQKLKGGPAGVDYRPVIKSVPDAPPHKDPRPPKKPGRPKGAKDKRDRVRPKFPDGYKTIR